MKLSWGSFFAMDKGENWIGFQFGDSITIVTGFTFLLIYRLND
ncbi:hypothetical protein ACQKIC_02855 [Peribacillus sp. NPDC046944]